MDGSNNFSWKEWINFAIKELERLSKQLEELRKEANKSSISIAKLESFKEKAEALQKQIDSLGASMKEQKAELAGVLGDNNKNQSQEREKLLDEIDLLNQRLEKVELFMVRWKVGAMIVGGIISVALAMISISLQDVYQIVMPKE